MARSCGIRIGPTLARRDRRQRQAQDHRLHAGELPRDGDDDRLAPSPARAARANVPKDNVGVAIDTGLAAFRTIKVPFSDKARSRT
jgi:hypothetical protein